MLEAIIHTSQYLYVVCSTGIPITNTLIVLGAHSLVCIDSPLEYTVLTLRARRMMDTGKIVMDLMVCVARPLLAVHILTCIIVRLGILDSTPWPCFHFFTEDARVSVLVDISES